MNKHTAFSTKEDRSHHHLDEIRSCSASRLKTKKQECPKPKSFSDLIVYWVHFFYSHRKPKPSGYWRYVIGVYKNLFLGFYFNWIMIFTSPMSSIAFVLVYPIISSLLFTFEIILKIFMDFLGGAKLVKRISQHHGQGFGMINWGAPELLLSPKTTELIQSALPLLGEPCDKGQVSDGRHRTFHISIAQTMTVLSSLVYERQDHKATQAYKLLDKSKHKEDMASQLIWESESRIRSIAAGYGLCFLGITELKSLGGPFCGIYWSETQPFIIIAFKGTTPTNYSEFLVDATLQRTDARGFLFGSAHEGFYHSLFPIQGDQDDERDPYFSIQETVIEKARYLQKKLNTAKPIQVWITGHSLGAATGALLFARWLKCPEDLSIHCELRDAYVLGSPSVGDNDFASEFASYSNMPSTRSNMLWRIINKSDVICRIPPGYNNPTVGHYMQTTDFFNYSHVGHAVQITHPIIHAHPLECYPSSYQPNLKVDIVAGDYDGHWDEQVPSKTSFWHRNTIPIIESFYPFFIRDHIPIHYFKGLERARVYYHSPCADPKKGNHT